MFYIAYNYIHKERVRLLINIAKHGAEMAPIISAIKSFI